MIERCPYYPITFKREPEFDIETELYAKWGALIKENIKPDFMLCGHTHDFCISKPGDEYDSSGHPCSVIVGSDVNSDTSDVDNVLAGAYIKLNSNIAGIKFNTKKQIIGEGTVKF